MGRTIEKLIIKNYGDMLKAGEGIINADQIRTIEIKAIVVTGATYVCISRKNIKQLG